VRKIDLAVLMMTAASMAACGRDPAKEAPIAMKAGLYEVKLTGGGLAQFAQPGPGVTESKICVSETDTENFPKKLVRNYLSMGPTCGSVDFERTGNAVTGRFSCGVDPERATGEIKTEFSGIVSEERFDLQAQTKFDITFNDPKAQAEMSKSLTRGVPIKLTAQRQGDCQPS
jgi:hypothetical protein